MIAVKTYEMFMEWDAGSLSTFRWHYGSIVAVPGDQSGICRLKPEPVKRAIKMRHPFDVYHAEDNLRSQRGDVGWYLLQQAEISELYAAIRGEVFEAMFDWPEKDKTVKKDFRRVIVFCRKSMSANLTGCSA